MGSWQRVMMAGLGVLFTTGALEGCGGVAVEPTGAAEDFGASGGAAMSVEEAPAVTGDAGNGVVAERSGQIESGDPVGAAEAADVVTEVWQPDSVDAGATEDPDVTPPAEELVDADAEASAAPEGGGIELRAMSYNLFGWNALRENPWKGDNMLAFITEQSPDFLGAQEVEEFADSIVARLPPGYAVSPARGNGLVTFYRTDRWRAVDHGEALLNEMDQWGQRVLRWTYFEHLQTGRGVHVYNTHFCVCGEAQLRGSATTVAAAIADRARPDAPAILTGDFNVFGGYEESPAVRYLKGDFDSPVQLRDSYRVVHPEGAAPTFDTAGKIDYVFVSPDLQVTEAMIDRDFVPYGQASDHHPVQATLWL